MSRLNRIILYTLLSLWTLPSALWLYVHNTSEKLQTGSIAAEVVLALSPEPDTSLMRTTSRDAQTGAIARYVSQYSEFSRARDNVQSALLPPAIGYGVILLLLLPMRVFKRRRLP